MTYLIKRVTASIVWYVCCLSVGYSSNINVDFVEGETIHQRKNLRCDAPLKGLQLLASCIVRLEQTRSLFFLNSVQESFVLTEEGSLIINCNTQSILRALGLKNHLYNNQDTEYLIDYMCSQLIEKYPLNSLPIQEISTYVTKFAYWERDENRYGLRKFLCGFYVPANDQNLIPFIIGIPETEDFLFVLQKIYSQEKRDLHLSFPHEDQTSDFWLKRAFMLKLVHTENNVEKTYRIISSHKGTTFKVCEDTESESAESECIENYPAEKDPV